MNNYTIYAHLNKINGKVYIGMTCQKTKNRWKNGNGYKNNERFNDDIKKYGWESFEHKIIACNLSEDEASDIERFIINELKAINQEKVYNKMTGGIKSGMKGRKHKELSKNKISKTMKERVFTDEHKKHISESKKGKKHHFAKPVYQYKRNGEFIKMWDYMSEASKELNICKASISECCLGKRKTAGGYVWSYKQRGG